MTNSIVLVNPLFRTDDHDQQLFRPLGVAALASQMKSLGLPVYITDCTFKTFDDSVREIVGRDPAIIGLSISIHTDETALLLLRELREQVPGTLFIAGGPMPTVFPERYAEYFDVVFRGEGDLVVPRFCRDYLALRKRDKFHHVLEFYTYPGVYTRFRSQLIQYAPIHYPSPILDTLPIPYRKDMNHGLYQQYWMERSGCRPTTVMAARGCPHENDSGSNPVFGRIHRKRSLDRVVREIDVAERDGYNQIWFVDDFFTFDAEYTRSFCELIAARPRKMQWTCWSWPEGLTPDLVGAMCDSGCVAVNLEIDSGAEETLRLMNRSAGLSDSMRSVEMLAGAGIRVGASFLVGLPGESRELVEKTFAFALSNPFDEVFFNLPFHINGASGHEHEYVLSRNDGGNGQRTRLFMYSPDIDPEWLERRIGETLDQFRNTRELPTVPLEAATI